MCWYVINVTLEYSEHQNIEVYHITLYIFEFQFYQYTERTYETQLSF